MQKQRAKNLHAKNDPFDNSVAPEERFLRLNNKFKGLRISDFTRKYDRSAAINENNMTQSDLIAIGRSNSEHIIPAIRELTKQARTFINTLEDLNMRTQQIAAGAEKITSQTEMLEQVADTLANQMMEAVNA